MSTFITVNALRACSLSNMLTCLHYDFTVRYKHGTWTFAVESDITEEHRSVIRQMLGVRPDELRPI